MLMFDNNDSVLQWASESLNIPYQNPLTGKWTMYIPDFLVIYVDKDGKKHGEVIEVKPIKETLVEHAKSHRDKLTQVINAAKWASASGWCRKNGLHFRVVTEKDLFQKPPRGKK